MSGQGYEMTPFGMVPIGTPHISDPELAARVVVHADYGHDLTGAPAQPTTSAVSTTPLKYEIAVTPGRPATTPTSPRTVIQSAKARVKEIKSELKRMRALQKELGELERLLKAAKQKPTSVRPLRSVG